MHGLGRGGVCWRRAVAGVVATAPFVVTVFCSDADWLPTRNKH